MARVPYIQDHEATDQARAVLARVEARRGGLSPALRAFANSPTALEAFDRFSSHVNSESCLEPAIREIVVLRVAERLKNRYEWRRHVPKALALGVSAAQIESLKSSSTEADFDQRQRSALRVVDEFLDRWSLSDEAGAALTEHFASEEIIELLMTLGWYLLVAALILPLGIDADEQTSD